MTPICFVYFLKSCLHQSSSNLHVHMAYKFTDATLKKKKIFQLMLKNRHDKQNSCTMHNKRMTTSTKVKMQKCQKKSAKTYVQLIIFQYKYYVIFISHYHVNRNCSFTGVPAQI
jgi:hypothetical protein